LKANREATSKVVFNKAAVDEADAAAEEGADSRHRVDGARPLPRSVRRAWS
jgi:hypothetical protein